ncbi:MAG: SulP family inorganic anion transporter, partial [Rhodoferax sp.]|nr:SulP family inorganic anion transporter [Rhodoferax sp.]
FISYVTLLALLSGVFQIGLGMARAGVLLNLLSHPVLMGFINASALVIALSQLPALTGINLTRSDSFMLDLGHLLASADNAHVMSIAAGVLAVAMLYGFKRLAPRLPGVLIMVAVLTVLSYATGFAQHGGQVIGAIPAGMPSISVPAVSWDATIALLPAAFVIALVSFTEAMSSCKVIAVKTRTRWDENQELIGQGMAKVVAAFCNSMPVSGSFSRSALNLASHACTGFSSLFAAGFVFLTLMFFTPLLYHLPKPALAAMILMAVVNLVDPASMRNSWLAHRDDGIAALLTFVATLAFAPNIQNGILVGILFSLGAFIYRRMAPPIVLVGFHEDGSLRDAQAYQLPPLPRTIAAMRFDAALFFANASFFEDAVLRLERNNPELKYILVDAHGINMLDASAVEMLRLLLRHLQERGITLVFSGAKRRVLEVVERTGLMQEIGAANFFDSDKMALQALMGKARLPEVEAGR